MVFSYLRSKLPIFIACQKLCLNKIIVSHDHHQQIINGGFKSPTLRKYVSKVHVFSSFMCLSKANCMNSIHLQDPNRFPVLQLFRHADRKLVQLSNMVLNNGIKKRISCINDIIIYSISRYIHKPIFKTLVSRLHTGVHWARWLRNPSSVLLRPCVLIIAIFAGLERIPYSRRYHFVMSCNMLERELGEYVLKKFEEEFQGSILPPTSPKSIRVQSILGEIVQAMQDGLRLEKNCSVSVYASKDHGTAMPIFGQRQHASRKLGQKWVRKLGQLFGTKHLDGLNWEVMVVDSEIENASYIPNGKIVFYTGLLDRLKSDAEVANVLGHEVGHGIARHVSEGIMKVFWIIILALMLCCVPHHPPYNENLSQWLLLLDSFFIRRKELEADYIGLMLMASAGYDPRVAPKLHEAGFRDSGQYHHELDLYYHEFDLYSTHPPGYKRAEKLNQAKVMEQALSIYKQVINGHGVTSFI